MLTGRLRAHHRPHCGALGGQVRRRCGERCLWWRRRGPRLPQRGVFFYFYGYGDHRDLHSFPTRRSSDLGCAGLSCGPTAATVWIVRSTTLWPPWLETGTVYDGEPASVVSLETYSPMRTPAAARPTATPSTLKPVAERIASGCLSDGAYWGVKMTKLSRRRPLPV